MLLVDLDGQKNATTSVMGQKASAEESGRATVMTWLAMRNSLEETVFHSGEGWGFDLIPGSTLLNIYSELFTTLNEFRIVEAVEKSGLRDQYDIVVFDTAPAINDLLMAALMATDEVIFVSTPYRESPDGIIKVYEQIELIQGNPRYNPNLKVDGVLITMMQNQYKTAKECAKRVRTYFSQYVNVYDTVIRYSPRAASQSYRGQSINVIDPTGIATADYSAFVKEWLARHTDFQTEGNKIWDC